jgi:hypothetical protein
VALAHPTAGAPPAPPVLKPDYDNDTVAALRVVHADVSIPAWNQAIPRNHLAVPLNADTLDCSCTPFKAAARL